jgi:metal-responsive CopG/Arc/MetJ family transcriptional regulator
MNRDTIRLNITLPKSLVASLDAVAGYRKRSSFIADAVNEKIEQLKKAEMEMLLQEGYQKQHAESIRIVKAFEELSLAKAPKDGNR